MLDNRRGPRPHLGRSRYKLRSPKDRPGRPVPRIGPSSPSCPSSPPMAATSRRPSNNAPSARLRHDRAVFRHRRARHHPGPHPPRPDAGDRAGAHAAARAARGRDLQILAPRAPSRRAPPAKDAADAAQAAAPAPPEALTPEQVAAAQAAAALGPGSGWPAASPQGAAHARQPAPHGGHRSRGPPQPGRAHHRGDLPRSRHFPVAVRRRVLEPVVRRDPPVSRQPRRALCWK